MERNLTLIFVLLTLFACKKEHKENSGGGSSTQNFTMNSFPLTVGNSWKYYTEIHIADSAGYVWYNYYYDSYWSVVSDTSINGVASAKVLQRDSNLTNGNISAGYTYYANNADGLYGTAHDDGNGLYLRSAEKFKLNLFGWFNESLNTNAIVIPDTPLCFMKFPSQINDIWYSYEYNSPIPDVVKRKWVGYQTVNTNAGTFNCIKLMMFWDKDHNNLPDSGDAIVYQYFTDKGLIQVEEHASLLFNNPPPHIMNRITKLVWKNF